jgi:hypothetical protein
MSEVPGSNRARDDHFRPGPDRFVPTGVDAQSWIGFEHRIQERRFRALLQTIGAATAKGDGVTARMALEEARELRPDAPELADAQRRIALLPAAMPVPASSGYFGSRTFNAFGLLFVGVALVTALDFMRSTEPAEADPAAAPALTLTTPGLNLDTVERPTPALADVTPPPAVVEPEIETTPAVAKPDSGDAIGTAGDAVVARAEPAPAPEPPPVREQVVTAPVVPTVTLADAAIDRQPASEIPDDFVAPQSRRDAIVASPLLPRASRGPLLIPPPPVSGAAAAPPPAAASAAIAPVRRDETLVSSVLDRYARAYDALDASAAREVWPTVDERALARAFAGLESQHVSFDDCSIDVRGETANASCRGLASYVGKVGSRAPRTEPRQWTFELRRDGAAWKIESAQTRLTQ